jgi:hypothetical protein
MDAECGQTTESGHGILAAMPTPETAEAFARLVEAREKLNEVTRALNEAHADMHNNAEARQRHLDLQKAWSEAFKEFETATQALAAAVIRAKEKLGSATE